MGYQTGKNKQLFTTDIGMKDYYKYYGKNFKSIIKSRSKILNNKFNIDYSLYKDILGDINLGLRDMIVKKPTDFKMPGGLGTICIRKKKKRLIFDENNVLQIHMLPIDWKTTHKMWKERPELKEKKKLFRFTNDHTNNYVYEWYYIKYNLRFKGCNSYYYYPTREGKKLLFEQITNNPDYNAELRYPYVNHLRRRHLKEGRI